jgi:hypothetical protein
MATRCPSCDIVLTIEEADANVCPGCGGKISATMSSPQQGEHSPQAEHEPASESESLRTRLYWLVVAVLALPAIAGLAWWLAKGDAFPAHGILIFGFFGSFSICFGLFGGIKEALAEGRFPSRTELLFVVYLILLPAVFIGVGIGFHRIDVYVDNATDQDVVLELDDVRWLVVKGKHSLQTEMLMKRDYQLTVREFCTF